MPKITDISQLDLNQTYSYADYLTWQFNETVELIKGKIMLMSPAPNVEHQRIERKLLVAIDPHLKDKKCELFPAPFDVRLYHRKKSLLASHDCMDATTKGWSMDRGRAPTVGALGDAGAVAEDIHTVVQPDLCVICNPDILDKRGCNGAPGWIIEILSKGTAKRDMQLKYELYQENGVQEYWIVYPNDQAVHQFVLDDNECYQLKHMYTDDDIATPYLFPDLAIDLSEIFETWQEP
ncbi:MAG: Uma2 family endonuclease [Methylovulum sp.]|nr:Uma2 family endonuclease [Methylovulum sp.]